jgi:hypothetical protein
MSFLLFLYCYCDILNRLHCFFRRSNVVLCDKSLFVERVNENAMYNKTVIKFGFCDILNYQDLGKCYPSCFRLD